MVRTRDAIRFTGRKQWARNCFEIQIRDYSVANKDRTVRVIVFGSPLFLSRALFYGFVALTKESELFYFSI